MTEFYNGMDFAMDDQSIERRLTRIEEMLAKLDYSGLRTHEILSVADLKLELRVDRIEARIKELGDLERIAQEAYLRTHPDAQAGLYEVIDAVEAARGDIYFSNLPTVKDHRREPKS